MTFHLRVFGLWAILLVPLYGCSASCNPSHCPVALSTGIPADDATLHLQVRGEDRDAPVLLWLHGGPGAPETPLFRLYNSELEASFVVAYWDQRGAGRSFDDDADPSRLTVSQHLEDLDVVVDYLGSRLGKEKVILAGHSWGSAMGLLYAHRHPNKVATFVGIAQFVSGLEAQRAQYAFVAAEARRAADRDALRKLAVIGAPPFAADEVLRIQSLVDRFGGYFHNRPSFVLAMLRGALAGYAWPWEIPRFIRANNVSLRAMHDEITSLDLRRSVPSVEVPVIMMLGRHDRHLDARIARRYYEQIDAPSKELIWFDRSAHNIPFEQPDAFNRRIVDALRRANLAGPGKDPE